MKKLLRSSEARWRELHMLLCALERSAEASARLDAYLPEYSSQLERRIVRFDARMRTLERMMTSEMNRLTCEKLFMDLGRKRQ